MAISYPLINGLYFDWSSVEINIDGDVVVGIKEITYSDTTEPGEVRGTAPNLIGRTRGEYKVEGSFTMYKPQAQELIAKFGDGWMEKVFVINVSYADDGQDTITDVLTGCRIKKFEDSPKAGNEAAEVKFDLHLMYIKRNDLAPVNHLLEG